LALDEAVLAYQAAHEATSRYPALSEHTATPELTLLYCTLEKIRATALILAACCGEAAANLYLSLKTTAEQFALLEWAKFLEKWTVVPSLFVPGYSFPKDGKLYQDLKRLNARRNSLVHLKEEVTTRGGAVPHAGSHPEAASDEHVFVGRCRSLPDKLLSHLASFDKIDASSQVRLVLAISPFMQKLGDSMTTG
jgi:hypothetical protein